MIIKNVTGARGIGPVVKLAGCTLPPSAKLPGSHSKPTGLHYLPSCTIYRVAPSPGLLINKALSPLLRPPQTVLG